MPTSILKSGEGYKQHCCLGEAFTGGGFNGSANTNIEWQPSPKRWPEASRSAKLLESGHYIVKWKSEAHTYCKKMHPLSLKQVNLLWMQHI